MIKINPFQIQNPFAFNYICLSDTFHPNIFEMILLHALETAIDIFAIRLWQTNSKLRKYAKPKEVACMHMNNNKLCSVRTIIKTLVVTVHVRP